MKTLGEVFNPYLADKPLADDISSAELLKLNINSNNRSITMTAKFGGLVLRDNLFAAEKQISKSELNLGSVRINPIYDSKLFSADYFPELDFLDGNCVMAFQPLDGRDSGRGLL